MILLDKLTNSYKSGLALLLIPFFFACDDPSQLGLEVDNSEDEFTVQKLELTLPASTIAIDSLRTDHFNVSVVGQYQDQITGNIKAITYNKYNINGGQLPDEGDSLKYSRAFIRMRVFDTRQDAALTGETISIHRATDSLFTSAVYLADREVPYEEEPIASHTYNFNPQVDTVLEIPLGDDFGRFLFDRLDKVTNPGGDYADSLTRNLYYYDPLVFVPGEENQGLLAFDLTADTSAIYVEMVNDDGAESYYTFDFRDKHYNRIIRDKSTAQLSDLTTEYTPSSNTSEYSYIDMMAGVYTKLDLQPFIDFVNNNPDVLINNSLLNIETATPPSIYTDNLDRINYFFVAPGGRINGAGALEALNTQNVAIATEASYLDPTSSTLLVTPINDQRQYKVAPTLFLQEYIERKKNDDEFPSTELVLTSPRTLSLNQSNLINSEIKLTLYYTSLKE